MDSKLNKLISQLDKLEENIGTRTGVTRKRVCNFDVILILFFSKKKKKKDLEIESVRKRVKNVAKVKSMRQLKQINYQRFVILIMVFFF